jgi:branched-chain amino acid transport system substrate-binding protein
VTLGKFDTKYSTELQKPAGANFWEWIKTANFKV